MVPFGPLWKKYNVPPIIREQFSMKSQKSSKKEITKEILFECFFYDEDDGELYWKERPVSHFSSRSHQLSWNKRFAGSMAGVVYNGRNTSYKSVCIFYQRLQVHTVIWWMTYGYRPKLVDHDDRNGLNNKLFNLSDKSTSDNAKNCKKRVDNKTGITGISKHRNRYQAFIGRKYLGVFPSLEEAKNARKAAEIKEGYHENHGN